MGSGAATAGGTKARGSSITGNAEAPERTRTQPRVTHRFGLLRLVKRDVIDKLATAVKTRVSLYANPFVMSAATPVNIDGIVSATPWRAAELAGHCTAIRLNHYNCDAMIAKYLDDKRKSPDNTSALFFAPVSRAVHKSKFLKHMREIGVVLKGTPALEDEDGNSIPLMCDMRVYYDAPGVHTEKCATAIDRLAFRLQGSLSGVDGIILFDSGASGTFAFRV